jgi:hypothetical protein
MTRALGALTPALSQRGEGVGFSLSLWERVGVRVRTSGVVMKWVRQ